MEKRRELYKKICVVALPIVFQNIIDAAVSSADVLMLNYVGQSAIGAVSLANSMVGILFMFLYGIGTGIAMLAAQYYGKGDMKTIEKVEGIGHKFALSVAALGALLCLLIPRTLMRIYTNDETLIEIGSKYLMFIAPGLLFWAVSAVYMSILRCIDKVTVSTVLEAVALVCNVTLNAVFIFGLFGAPKLGVIGVAIATTTSRLIQLIGCILVSVFMKPGVALTLKTMFQRHKTLEHDFFTMAMPAIGNDLAWSLAFSAYSAIIGHLGEDAVAAYSIINVVRNLGCVMCYGIGMASGIIVGQILGEGRKVFACMNIKYRCTTVKNSWCINRLIRTVLAELVWIKLYDIWCTCNDLNDTILVLTCFYSVSNIYLTYNESVCIRMRSNFHNLTDNNS